MQARSVILVAITMLVGELGCSSDSCTDLGCTSSSLIAGEMPVPNGVVTVDACRNGQCTTLSDAAAQDCKLVQGEPRIEVCFSPSSATTHIDVIVYHDPSSPPLADGDAYSVKVRDASGASLVDFSGNAEYEDYRPNGAGCEPVCKTAELSL